MINIEDDGLFEVFPAIQTISEAFEYQNSMLNKIVLTGKINALEIAENLFNFTEQTAQTFTELQSQIVLNLLRENKEELFTKAKTKVKIAIDTVMRNIHIRKADIETLSQDEIIQGFCESKYTKEDVKERLNNFIKQYTIYNEIIIVDKNGSVKVNVNSENKVRYSQESIFKDMNDTETKVYFKSTDLFVKQKQSLFFVKALPNDRYLVVFLKFEDEAKIIFDNLITENENITICDKFNNIIISSEKGMDKSSLKGIKKVGEFAVNNGMFYVKEKSDYNELDWYGVISYKKRADVNILAEFENQNTNNQLAQIHLNNNELQKLADDGYSILEDLSDVIINGELIAAKSKQYVLIPILDNLREVSFRIVKLIELSIRSLQKIIDDSIVNDVTIISKFIVDELMRNLYEICGDIKWWAITLSDFELSELSTTLKKINEFYPNYSDIFVYDSNLEIKSISNSTKFIGEKIEHINISRNAECTMTNFIKTKFYDGMTYMFFSPIKKDDKVIGGIGAVFDIKKQFADIFNRAFIYTNGIGIICDKNKNILYSTQDIGLDFIDELKEGVKNIEVEGKKYKLSISKSTGYREIKKDDLYSIILMER